MPAFVQKAFCGLAFLVVLLRAGPAAAGDCKGEAVEALKAGSPNGYAIFRQIEDKTFFRTWLDCKDATYGVPTAVHESVHLITGDTDAYPLVGGGAVRRPPQAAALFAPGRIARRFRPSVFVSTYLLPGSASSAADFRYLLDELNGYTHELDTAIALHGLRDLNLRLSHRDGLAALMSFVALYVEAAETTPAAWKALERPAMAAAVSALWDQAERTMVASCRSSDLGSEDEDFLGKLCAAKPQAALARLLGRAPVCPTACLTGRPEAARPE